MAKRHSYPDYTMRRSATPVLLPGAWPSDGVSSTSLYLNPHSPVDIEGQRQLKHVSSLAKEEIRLSLTSRRRLELLVDRPSPKLDIRSVQEPHPHNTWLNQSVQSTLVSYGPRKNGEQGLRHRTYRTEKYTECLQPNSISHETQESQAKGKAIRFLEPDTSGVSGDYSPFVQFSGTQVQNSNVLACSTVPSTLNGPNPTIQGVLMMTDPIGSQKPTISDPSSIVALTPEMDPTINIEIQQTTKGIEEMRVIHRSSELLHHTPGSNECAPQVEHTDTMEVKAKVPHTDVFTGKPPLCHDLMQSSRNEVTSSTSGHISKCHGDRVADQAQGDDRKNILSKGLEAVKHELNVLKENQQEASIPKFGNKMPSRIAAAISRRTAVVEADLNRASVLYNNEKVMLGEFGEVARLLSEIKGIGALLQRLEASKEDVKTAWHQQHKSEEEHAKTRSRNMISTETHNSTKIQHSRVRPEEKLQRADAKNCAKRMNHNQYGKQRSSIKSCFRTPFNQFREPISSTTQSMHQKGSSKESHEVEQGGLISVQHSRDRVIHTLQDHRLSVSAPTNVSAGDEDECPYNTFPPNIPPANSFELKQLHPRGCMPPSPPLSPPLSSQCNTPRTQVTHHLYHDIMNMNHEAKNAVPTSSSSTQTAIYDGKELVIGHPASTSTGISHLLREPMKQHDPSGEGPAILERSAIGDGEDDYVEVGLENLEWEIVDQNVVDSPAEAIGSGRYEWMVDLMKRTVL